MIKPTIGRIVLYNDNNSDQMTPGIICYVHSDELINIAGFSRLGVPNGRTNVPLYQGDGEIPVRHAGWMSYQKGQAAITASKEPS